MHSINDKMKRYAVFLAVVLIGIAAACTLTPSRFATPSIQEAQTAVQETSQTVVEDNGNKVKTHVVNSGETLGTIAEKYNIDVDTLLGANPNVEENSLQPGDQLVILPQKGVMHTTDMGDTLWSIANAYGVEVAAIMNANSKNSEDIAIGEKIFIPGAKPLKSSEQLVARAEYSVSRAASSASRFSWPARGELTSYYGYRWGRLHAGIDIANDVGTPVTAAMSGRVTYTGWSGGYGNTLIIEHNRGYETLYGHLSGFAVSPGQYVRAGQTVAYMGNTGNSTGPHLHFEVHEAGSTINPLNVLP